MIQINYTEINFAQSNFCSPDSQLAWRIISTDRNTPTKGKSCAGNLRIAQLNLLSPGDTEAMTLQERGVHIRSHSSSIRLSHSSAPAVFPQSLRLDHQSHYFTLIFTASINVTCQIWSHQMQGLQPRTQTCNESAKILIPAIFLCLILTRVCFSS